ncbi:hypothetical protein GGX14DRAFT_387382 [Mycena pura]|uniref:Uncharacterized protein n=1 Tax=Mycena pura TaxID=153505 RepID=A0AAD6YP01_9AGAR|nr:hypothetical protein GGX14DRAFT_387382 [Mycena pura]
MSDLSHKNIRKLMVDVTDDESVAVGIKKVYEETEGIDIFNLKCGNQPPVSYTISTKSKLAALIRSCARLQYTAGRRQTQQHAKPGCSYPWDTMHLFFENVIPNLGKFWSGNFSLMLAVTRSQLKYGLCQ